MKYWPYIFYQTWHWLNANSRHGTHSPFVYRLVDELLYVKPSDKDRQRWSAAWSGLSLLEIKKRYLILRLLQEFPFASCTLDGHNTDVSEMMRSFKQVGALANFHYIEHAENLSSLLTHCMEHDVIIVNEPYLNSKQLQYWKDAIADREVVVSVDLFHLGLLFFRKGQRKEDFKIRFNIQA